MSQTALMYHDVVAPGDPDASGFAGAAAAHYKLDREAFDQHLQALTESGLSFGSVLAASGANDAWLTFDDGGASAPSIALALDRHRMTGHFFITTGRIGQTGFVRPDDVLALHRGGHVVGSHSHTHPAEISRLSDSALAAEWHQSVDCLSQWLSAPIQVASVPGGFYSRRVAQAAAAAGIRYLFTSEPSMAVHQVDGCLVLGRYTLWRGMPASRALALALGSGAARQQQWLMWNLKKPLKRWARPAYQLLRRRLLAAG
ncbi:MAG: polysaccharide deacetylase family protein [Dyella sp.]